jgi:hypothetical protein
MIYSREMEVAGQILGVEPEQLPEAVSTLIGLSEECLHKIKGQRNLNADFVAVIVAVALFAKGFKNVPQRVVAAIAPEEPVEPVETAAEVSAEEPPEIPQETIDLSKKQSGKKKD